MNWDVESTVLYPVHIVLLTILYDYTIAFSFWNIVVDKRIDYWSKGNNNNNNR